MMKPRFATLWALMLLALLGFAANKVLQGQISVRSDMLSLLGQDSTFDQKIAHSSTLQQQKLLLVISGQDQSKTNQTAARIAEQLQQLGLVTQALRAPDQQSLLTPLLELYRQYPFTLLDNDYLKALGNDNPSAIENKFLQGLVGTINPFVNQTFEQDPTLASAFSLQSLLTEQSQWSYDGNALYQQQADNFYYPIFIDIDAKALGVNQSIVLNGQIEALIADNLTAEQQVYRSGLVFHVASASQSAKSEISLFSTISTLLIIILALVIFRSLMPIIAILLLMAVAIGFGAAGLIASVNEVHLLTFIFAVSLIGISVDYAFHTLAAAYSSGEKPIANLTRYLAPAMLMGAMTTVLGYMSMLLMPLKALHQITLFMIFGLIAALATALFWLSPIYQRKQPLKLATPVLNAVKRISDFCAHLRCVNHIFMVVAAFIALFAVADFKLSFDDNVASLNSASTALIAQEAKVQKLMGYASYPRYLVFKGVDDQQVLAKMHQANALLGDEVKSFSLAKWVPTRAMQSQSKGQMRQYIAGDKLPQMSGYLEPEQMNQLDSQLDNILLPEQWPQSLELLAQKLWQADGLSYGLVSYYGELSTSTQARLQDTFGDIEFVDQPKRLSAALYDARASLITFFILAILAFMLVLVVRYGLAQGLFSLLTPLFAALGSLLLSQLLQQQLSIFNLLSCLLIGALAIDYIVFFNEQGHKPHVVLAILLSALSSMAAFGMMALSHTPAVQHFGLSTAFGIVLAVLMAFVTPLKNKEHR